jgi:4-amino-4-deoxy-L-arabinose transferase-like glycosyltransferase
MAIPHQRAGSGKNPMKINRLVLVALSGFFALIFLLRLHTYNEPLERDLTTYAVIAHEMLEGKALYSEMWDHKPPAIHVTYAAAELIAGYGRNSIFLMNIAAALVTLVACYVAGSAAGGGPLGGLIAAGLWALASGDLTIEGNQPNTEVFLNAFLTTAFAIFVRTQKTVLGLRRALLAGVLFAIASLYKQVAVVPVFLLACTHIALAPTALRKQALSDVARIGAIGALAWAFVFGYFAVHDRSDAFIDAAFKYNQFYAGSTLHNLSLWHRIPPLAPHALLLGLLVGAITLTGLVLGMIYGPRRPWALLLAVLVGTHIAVLLPGQFFPHYYQLWLPPLVIGVGWTIGILKRILPVHFHWVSYATAATAIVGLGLLEFQYYQTSPENWSIRKYGRVFVETDRLALTLNKLLKKNESFYEWGSESGLYYATKHEPPSGIMFTDPMLLGPLKKELLQRLSDDLQRVKPDLIILEKQTVRRTAPSHPFLVWVKENYHAISQQHGFLLLARKDSKLDQEKIMRLNQASLSAPL